MKKSLLACSVILMASAGFTANAANQFSAVPEDGSKLNINVEGQGYAVASIEINTKATINRDAEGFIVLSRNGVPLKAIPACNKLLLYCIDEFDKVTTGTPHITFYNKESLEMGNLTQITGKYQVTIPSNFFINSAGEGNMPLVYNYEVQGHAAELQYSLKNGDAVESLTELKITFPGCTDLKYSAKTSQDTKTGIYVEATDPENDENVLNFDSSSVTIDGNVATITFPELIANGKNLTGTVSINILANCFSFKNSAGLSGNNLTKVISVGITGNLGTNDQGFTFAPAPGTYEKFTALNSYVKNQATWGTTFAANFLTLDLPQGYTTGFVTGTRCQFYKVESDGTEVPTAIYFPLGTNEDHNVIYLSQTTYYDVEEIPADATPEQMVNQEFTLAPGTYYFVIPAKSFQTKAPGTDVGVYNNEMRFGPYVIEGDESFNYTITPDPSKVVAGLSDITITFGENDDVKWNIGDWGTLTCGVIEYDFTPVVNGNVITVSIPSGLTTPGEWNLTLLGTYLRVNGMMCTIKETFIVERDYISELAVKCNGDLIESNFIENDPVNGDFWQIDVKTANSDTNTVDIEVVLPIGYNELYYHIYEFNNDPEQESSALFAPKRVNSTDLLAAGFKLAENNIIPNLKVGENEVMFTYGNNGDCLEPTPLRIFVEYGETVGINEVDAAEEAEYFTIDGLKVENPKEGLFIKVANGVATKVILK